MASAYNEFRAGKKIEDVDLPRIGHIIGVGEDVIHAILDVECSGGFRDKQGRLKMLYEPHVAYRCSSGSKRAALVAKGLAYPDWKRSYPLDSYPRFLEALKIDEIAALKACSWGGPQILGENFAAAGYPNVVAMIQDFVLDDDNQLEAMIRFIKSKKLDDDLRVVQQKGAKSTADDWRPFARGYNGSRYAENSYHTRLDARYKWWRGKPDTIWRPGDVEHEPFPPAVLVSPSIGPASGNPAPAAVSQPPAPQLPPAVLSVDPAAYPAAHAMPGSVMRPVQEPQIGSPIPVASWWDRIKGWWARQLA